MIRTLASGLGLVALGVAIVIGMLTSFGAFGSKAAQESAAVGLEATVEATNPQAESAAALGQTVTAVDVSWAVNDATEESLRKAFQGTRFVGSLWDKELREFVVFATLAGHS